MNITLEKAGKRFVSEWIFRNVDLSIQQGERYAILGSNGSGKSTLAQMIAGYLSPSEGNVKYDTSDPEKVPLLVSFTSPYLEVPEDYSLEDLVRFHFSLKQIQSGIQQENVAELLQLERAGKKIVKTFSSGMKQRLKLGLAILSSSEMLVIDEPFTNLDAEGKRWYGEMIGKYHANRTLLVCSNHQPEEYSFCQNQLEMSTLK